MESTDQDDSAVSVGESTDLNEPPPDVPDIMTASYSEITSATSPRRRPADLPSARVGYTHHDGDMTHFVADDLEFKIKLSSPLGSRGGVGGGGSLYRQLLQPPVQLDSAVLAELEAEAQRIAHSVDSLIESLSGVLHTSSSLAADNMAALAGAVSITCDAADNNIKSMYTILAKGEEVSGAMARVSAQAARVAEIKRLLHILENNL